MAVMFLLSISVSTSYAAGAYRVGDQGEEIAELQGKLVVLGYDVMADGAFGPAMADAIKEFQKSQGIKADGLIGPATYSALLGKDMPDISLSSNYISHKIISNAMDYIGVPYVFGGTSPYGFDCSGYVQYVFANAGISLPRTADVRAIWFSSQPTLGARRMSVFISATTILSTPVQVAAFPLIRSAVLIGARIILARAEFCKSAMAYSKKKCPSIAEGHFFN